MEGQLEKERSGGLGEEMALGETGVGVQGAGAERGSMITQGQSSCQTGGSLVGPANPPNYRGSGHQPRKRGAILTPRGEGLASQSLDFNRCLTSPPNRDGSWQDFRPEGRWESLTKETKIIDTGSTPPSLQEGSGLKGLWVPKGNRYHTTDTRSTEAI